MSSHEEPVYTKPLFPSNKTFPKPTSKDSNTIYATLKHPNTNHSNTYNAKPDPDNQFNRFKLGKRKNIENELKNVKKNHQICLDDYVKLVNENDELKRKLNTYSQACFKETKDLKDELNKITQKTKECLDEKAKLENKKSSSIFSRFRGGKYTKNNNKTKKNKKSRKTKYKK